MKKTVVFLCILLAVFALSAAPAHCLTPKALEELIQQAASLNLSEENLIISLSNADEPPPSDERFLNLVRGKIRMARLKDSMEEKYQGWDIPPHQLIGTIFALLAQGEKLPPLDAVALAERTVNLIVKPLELEAVLKELPRYYEGIVSTTNWEKKFNKILSRDYVSLDGGTFFHLIDFPEINAEWTQPLYIRLGDGAFELYEMDSSIEGWLYSFWLRRWQEGTMEETKLIVDWLNAALK
ncbi:MAG: hypothetical protein GX256_06755 [Fretibacterium sp.]|nr:hypothetical protein [Fretibacterium sp.]